MPVFTPPTEDSVSPIYVAGQDPYRPVPELGQRLMRFYGARPEGVTIFKLANGSYTTAPPYPYLDASVYSADEATVLITYLGGHTYEVSDDEAAALTAAGYGAGLS